MSLPEEEKEESRYAYVAEYSGMQGGRDTTFLVHRMQSDPVLTKPLGVREEIRFLPQPHKPCISINGRPKETVQIFLGTEFFLAPAQVPTQKASIVSSASSLARCIERVVSRVRGGPKVLSSSPLGIL